MSHIIMRGEPNLSELYLDTVLDEIREKYELVKERHELNLPEIIYYRMKQQSDDLFMINGATGKRITFGDLLKQAIPLARTLEQCFGKGTNIMVILRNHEYMAVVYYALFFAGVLPLLVDPRSTLNEIRHFLTITSPAIIFCDEDRHNDVVLARYECSLNSIVLKAEKTDIRDFCKAKGHLEDYDNFQIPDMSPESPVLQILTSGSSDFPKVTILTHKGLISQLPVLWSNESKFPRPTKLALLLSAVQWMTHTIIMISCPVFGVSLLMTPQKTTIDHVLNLIEKFEATFVLLGPHFTRSIAISASAAQLKSLQIVLTTGASLKPNTMALMMEKLPSLVHLRNGYGLTETHGFITMPGPGTSRWSNGKIVNTLLYKLVSEDGKDSDKGELYLKSKHCIFKGYFNNENAYLEMFSSDGWMMTGDIFYMDQNKDLYYVERKKLWFTYLNYKIAPEEIEHVISSVRGVQECVVADSEKGPAAVVILTDDCTDDTQNIAEQIHNTVNTTLPDYKRLRGGIVFASSVPCNHSGKIKRGECKIFLQKLLENVSSVYHYF